MVYSKYGAVKTTIDGIKFDSKMEALRYIQLIEMVSSGAITNLELQPAYRMEVAGMLICTYKADFKYLRGEAEIVEDVKGFITPVYRIKRKLMKALHGIDIYETGAGGRELVKKTRRKKK